VGSGPLSGVPAQPRRYADAGGNTIDTAINYRDGASEEILGQLHVGRRESFVVGSKSTVSRDRFDPNAAGNARRNLRISLETSLRPLSTDYLDVYWVHRWDRATPIEETMRAVDDVARAGKGLYTWHLRRSHLGRGQGEHPRQLARLVSLHRTPGALKPAPARHRTRTVAHGRGARGVRRVITDVGPTLVAIFTSMSPVWRSGGSRSCRSALEDGIASTGARCGRRWRARSTA
jgi:hypothetical protein